MRWDFFLNLLEICRRENSNFVDLISPVLKYPLWKKQIRRRFEEHLLFSLNFEVPHFLSHDFQYFFRLNCHQLFYERDTSHVPISSVRVLSGCPRQVWIFFIEIFKGTFILTFSTFLELNSVPCNKFSFNVIPSRPYRYLVECLSDKNTVKLRQQILINF